MKGFLSKLKFLLSLLIIITIIAITIGIVSLNPDVISLDVALYQFNDVLVGHAVVGAFLFGILVTICVTSLVGLNSKVELVRLRRKLSKIESTQSGHK
ncbi:MAG: LapA family protein [Gammaproteobacteria bacterium]|nr:LapA family protein [Gammaproteobacteria bacterium]